MSILRQLILIGYFYLTIRAFCHIDSMRKKRYDESDFVGLVKILNKTWDEELAGDLYEVEHLKAYKPLIQQANQSIPNQIFVSINTIDKFASMEIDQEYLLNGKFRKEYKSNGEFYQFHVYLPFGLTCQIPILDGIFKEVDNKVEYFEFCYNEPACFNGKNSCFECEERKCGQGEECCRISKTVQFKTTKRLDEDRPVNYLLNGTFNEE